MTLGRYVLGVGGLLCVLGSLGLGAVALRARLLPDWRGGPARLAESVLGFALLIGICEGVGTLGLFRFAPVVGVSLTAGIGLWWSSRQARGAGTGERAGGRAARRLDMISLAAALLISGWLLTRWAGPTLRAYDNGMLGLDSLWYHMPWAAWYAQSGQVAALHFTDVQYLTAFYPASGELLHGLGIVLMGNDVLSPVFNLVVLGLLLLAAWCIGHPRGVGAVSVAGAALAMAAPSLFNSQPGSADTDVLGVFFLLAAVALWVNSEPLRQSFAAAGSPAGPRARSGRDLDPGALAIAGIAAGLAISVRLNLLASVLGLTVAVIALSSPGRRRAVASMWVTAVAVAGGFWYLRNLLAVGNPFPWFGRAILPIPHPPIMQHTELSVWHYLTDGSVWAHVFLPSLESVLGPWWQAIGAAVIGGALLCVAFGPGRVVRVLGLLTLFSILGYLLTPGSAAGAAGHPVGFYFNFRYSAPALTLGLATMPLAAPLGGARTRWLTLAALVPVIGVTLGWDRPLLARYVAGAVISAIVVLLVGVGLGLASAKRMRALAPRRLALLVAAAVVLMAASAAGGYAAGRSYVRSRYVLGTGLQSVDRVWRWARGVHRARIAIGGTFVAEFQYPLWGADASNDVEYVAHRGPHGSFTPISTCRKWRQELNAGHYRYVVTSRAVNAVTRIVSFSPEYEWTRGDPGVRLVTRSPSRTWVQIFEIVHPLDAAGCARPRG